MDNFRVLYRVLKILEKSMDCEEFDAEQISAAALGISEERWRRLIAMLYQNGFISGYEIKRGLGGAILISGNRPEITLKGLEYLHDNSLMKKAAELAKGIASVI